MGGERPQGPLTKNGWGAAGRGGWELWLGVWVDVGLRAMVLSVRQDVANVLHDIASGMYYLVQGGGC